MCRKIAPIREYEKLFLYIQALIHTFRNFYEVENIGIRSMFTKQTCIYGILKTQAFPLGFSRESSVKCLVSVP